MIEQESVNLRAKKESFCRGCGTLTFCLLDLAATGSCRSCAAQVRAATAGLTLGGSKHTEKIIISFLSSYNGLSSQKLTTMKQKNLTFLVKH